MNISYLKYIFTKYRLFYLVLFLAYFSTFSILMPFISNENIVALKSIIYFPSAILMLAAYLVPIFDYRIYYQKSSANLYFSLPDKRVNLYRTSTYFHIFVNLIAFLLSVTFGIMILAIRGTDLAYQYLFYYLLAMSVLFISTYFFSAFLATRVYTLFDAIVINAAYIALPATILLVLYASFTLKNIEMNWYNISFIGACQKVSKVFPQMAIVPLNKQFEDEYVFLIMFGLGIILHLVSCQAIKGFKTEKIGDTTTSIFGYRLLLPLFCFLILTIANYQTGIASIVVVIIMILLYFLISLVGKKDFKLSWKTVLKFLLMFIVANLLVFLFRR